MNIKSKTICSSFSFLAVSREVYWGMMCNSCQMPSGNHRLTGTSGMRKQKYEWWWSGVLCQYYLKALYSSNIDIFYPRKIYWIDMWYHKMAHLTACRISVSLSFLNWIKNEMIFLSYLWINVANIDAVQKWETNWYFIGCQMPHFMIVLIPYIYLFNLSWEKKCLSLRNMEPLNHIKTMEMQLWNVLCNELPHSH